MIINYMLVISGIV